MKRCNIRAILLVAIQLVVTPALAVPIMYDEQVDGDLPDPFASNPPLLVLASGVNTIAGSISLSSLQGQSDPDNVLIRIPQGLTLRSIVTDIAQTEGLSPALARLMTLSEVVGVATPGNELATAVISIPSTGRSVFELALPLGPGDYLIYDTALLGTGSGLSKSSYLIEMLVVPEPISLLLVLVGAMVLVLRRPGERGWRQNGRAIQSSSFPAKQTLARAHRRT